MNRVKTHVIAALRGGWNVGKTGSSRAEKTFETKDEAVRYGRKVARARKTELVIHREDGWVSQRCTYGSDPASRRK